MKRNEMKWNEWMDECNQMEWNERKRGNEMNEWMNEWMNQWINGSMNEWNEWTEWNQWMNGWMNKWNEWMNERTNERMNECKETQWMNECKNEWMLVWQGPASFGDHGSHFTPKTQGFAPDSVFKPELTRSQSLTRPNYLMMMWLPWCGGHDDVVGQWQSSSRYSLVHIYRPHLPKGLRDPQVF